ncbi:MAG: hypothetical protein VB859_16100, partial [Planctomycetaceae bacterium]
MTSLQNHPSPGQDPWSDRHYELPPIGNSPSSTEAGTTPGSFAQPPQLSPGHAGAWTYSSPDTPGMPQPSNRTAWDFMPADWTLRPGFHDNYESAEAWQPPPGFFVAITQLEHARLGTVTP